MSLLAAVVVRHPIVAVAAVVVAMALVAYGVDRFVGLAERDLWVDTK